MGTRELNIQRRVLGSSASFGRNGEVIGIDFDTLLHRLLLFDGYVLRTVRFREMPFLLDAFGYDQTLELLNCGLIELRCEITQIGSERDAELKKLNRPTFTLIWIEAHDWEKYVSDCLTDVRSRLSLSDEKWRALESAIRARIRRLEEPVKKEIGISFTGTIKGASSVFAESLRLAGRRRRIPLVFPNFQVHVESSGDFVHVDSDLKYFRVPREELWELFRDGLMGVATLEQAIGEMKNYQAIGGFTPEELPVFEEKLSILANLAFPGHAEKRVARVAKIVGMPRFDPGRMQLKVDKLLSVRDSDELRTFRDWLATSDGLSDADVRQLVRGYRARFSGFVHSGSGSLTRLAVEGFMGVANSILGLGISVLDAFLIDALLPNSGPAAFVNKTFPSLFRRRRR